MIFQSNECVALCNPFGSIGSYTKSQSWCKCLFLLVVVVAIVLLPVLVVGFGTRREDKRWKAGLLSVASVWWLRLAVVSSLTTISPFWVPGCHSNQKVTGLINQTITHTRRLKRIFTFGHLVSKKPMTLKSKRLWYERRGLFQLFTPCTQWWPVREIRRTHGHDWAAFSFCSITISDLFTTLDLQFRTRLTPSLVLSSTLSVFLLHWHQASGKRWCPWSCLPSPVNCTVSSSQTKFSSCESCES